MFVAFRIARVYGSRWGRINQGMLIVASDSARTRCNRHKRTWRAPRHAGAPKADQPPYSSSSSGGKFMSRMRRESPGAMANPKATEKAVQTARILMMITPACPRASAAPDLQDDLARRRDHCPPWRTISKPVVTLNSCQKASEKYLVKGLSLIGWRRFAHRVGVGSIKLC
jgi:hypothetical protein